MIFLQPIVLWGLPLLLTPVVIHLLNRMRYRTVPWAAMMFLLAASRQATRQARVREWLILACRVLAVLALVFFLSRPMVGGWLGAAAGSRPNTILVLLDRSPSMEAADPRTRLSKRALALRRLAEAAGDVRGGARYVLIDSATLRPQEFASPAVLKDLSLAGPSDAAADIPAMLDAALEYLHANQAGRAEIWVCSDLQRSNWQPDAPGWVAVRERFRQQAQDTRVRLLALTQAVKENMAVRVTRVDRLRSGKGQELLITAEMTGQDFAPSVFPLTMVHEGARSQIEVSFGGQKMTTQCRLDLGPRTAAGWGWIERPADANPRDNQAFFVYPEDRCVKSVVVADAEAAGRVMRLAAAPAPLLLNQTAEIQDRDAPLKLDDSALLVWQTAAPTGAVEGVVRDFVASGGVVLQMPAETGEDGRFRVSAWRNTDGPLSRTQNGRDLPLSDVVFTRHAPLAGEGIVLAMFDHGKPFLTRKPFGRGAYYTCASLPVSEWSTLGEGAVLVPMVQRMVQEGARRLGGVAEADVGEARFMNASSLAGGDNREGLSLRTAAGIYQQDGRLVSANRPAAEDEPDLLDEDGVRAAMGTITCQMFEEKGSGSAVSPTEIWRWFLIAMLLFLTGEALFTLPTAAQQKRWDLTGERVAFGKEERGSGEPS